MIDLTPLEVRQKKADFSRALRGYEAGEVDDFLGLVADRLEALVKENMALKDRLARLEEQVTEFRQRERALTDALVTAQQMREEVRKQSSREADLLKQEAIQQAERIRAEGAQAREREEEILRRLRARQSQLIQSYRTFLERELSELSVVADSLAAPAEEPTARRGPGKGGQAGKTGKTGKAAPRAAAVELPLSTEPMPAPPGEGLADIAALAGGSAGATSAAAVPSLDAYGAEGEEDGWEEPSEDEGHGARSAAARVEETPGRSGSGADFPAFDQPGDAPSEDEAEAADDGDEDAGPPLPLLDEAPADVEADDYALALEMEAKLDEDAPPAPPARPTEAPSAPRPRAAEAPLPWEEEAEEEGDEPWAEGPSLAAEEEEEEEAAPDPTQLELAGEEPGEKEDDEPDWLSSILREEP